MKDHILEFVKPGTRLSKRRGLLLVKIEERVIEVPFSDIGGVLIISEDVILTSAVMSELLRYGVCIQVLDGRYMPQGLLTPYVGHQFLRGRLLAQIALSDAQINRLWQKIVIRKIENQAKVLVRADLESDPLVKFGREVDSGDTFNHEAQAARYYWSVLFGDEFRRDPNADGLNSFLNYGYAILRSAVARYVVGTGLNPSLGVFHSSMENPFCLVDDLMEPFRPLVDFYCSSFQDHTDFSSEIKKHLVSVLEHEVSYRGEKKPLRNAIAQYCQSFSKAVLEADYRIFDTDVEVF